MSFTFVARSGNGSQKSFTFSFTGQDEGYIREEDIKVTVGGMDVPFTLTSSNTLELVSAPPVGEDNVIIRRVMPKEIPYADFKRGNNFGQQVLNNSFLQLLYIVHELLDGYFPDGFSFKNTISFLKDLVLEGNLFVKGRIEVDESIPTSDKSVVNFEQGDIRYKQPLDEAVADYKAEDSSIRSEFKAADSQLRAGYTQGDSNLQAQISGGAPLEASAFSPISWHEPTIENSVVIPDGKNAWSFGPTMTVQAGQTITVGQGSFWTIANGETV